MLVVAVYAHTKNKDLLVCANVSERIIVRVSLRKRCLKLPSLAADVSSDVQRLWGKRCVTPEMKASRDTGC